MGTLTDLILSVVRKHFVYSVTRLGTVSKVEDEEQKGRILILIPSLGWNSDDLGVWCYPKDKKSFITPKINDYVFVEFINGDKNFPVYSGISFKMKDMILKNYDGKPTTQILFEDNLQETYVKYNEESKEFIISDSHGNIVTLKNGEITVKGTKVTFLAGNESFLKGDTFDNWITNTLKTIFDAHTHGGVTPGGSSTSPPASPLTVPSGHLSDKIKGE